MFFVSVNIKLNKLGKSRVIALSASHNILWTYLCVRNTIDQYNFWVRKNSLKKTAFQWRYVVCEHYLVHSDYCNVPVSVILRKIHIPGIYRCIFTYNILFFTSASTCITIEVCLLLHLPKHDRLPLDSINFSEHCF